MDLSGLEQFIPNVAAWLHVQPATVLFYLAVICTVCNIIGKSIPADATGWQGVVRKVCRIVGVAVNQKVSAGVTVTDAVTQIIKDAQNEPATPAPPVVPAFPGLANAPRDVESEGNMGRQPGEAI